MKRKSLFLLLLMLCIGIQAQKIKVDTQDKFTGIDVKRTSFEKMIMKWCTNEVRAIDKGETVIFLDEDGDAHPYTNSQYTISSRGEGTVGALGMDLQGVNLILTGNFSAFKDKRMTDLRIYTTDGYIDFKIKKSKANKLSKMYKLITK